jgi:hypothetical protein
MLTGLIARARSLWRGVARTSDIDADMRAEFRAHLELRADDLVRSGLSRAEATRQARLEFGSPDRYHGVAAGAALMLGLETIGGAKAPPLAHVAIITSYSAFMMCVCLLACIVPARRALQVEPTEALRSEG